MSPEEPKLNRGLLVTEMSGENANAKLRQSYDSWYKFVYCEVMLDHCQALTFQDTLFTCDFITCVCVCHFYMLDNPNVEIFYFVYGCFDCMCVCAPLVLLSEEGVKFPGTRIIEGCKLLFAVGSGN